MIALAILATAGFGAVAAAQPASATVSGSATGSGSGSATRSVSDSVSTSGSATVSDSVSASGSTTVSVSGPATVSVSGPATVSDSGSVSGSGSGSATVSGSDPGSVSGSDSDSVSVSDLLEQLSAAPDDAVSSRVAAIELAADSPSASSDPMLADALFSAARACEDRLRDPVRALVLYERILARVPDARVALAAGRRVRHLREQVGDSGAATEEARQLSRLMADAERLPLGDALTLADALAAKPWPGAPEVLLWSAELVRRRGDLADAMARYRAVLERYPGSPSATLAIRGLAGVAVERGDWELAERMARLLPSADPADVVTRDELLDKSRRGRVAGGWTLAARLILIASVLGFLLSMLSLVGWRRPLSGLRALWPPPVEVAYMAPGAILMSAASFTGNISISPAVITICGGGLVLAWLAGAPLSEARRRGRESRLRSLAHLLACVLSALSLAYLAVISTGLLDMLINTIQLGPER